MNLIKIITFSTIFVAFVTLTTVKEKRNEKKAKIEQVRKK